jgi:hypothetical protein
MRLRLAIPLWVHRRLDSLAVRIAQNMQCSPGTVERLGGPPKWTAPDGTIVYRSYADYCDD